MAEEPETLEDAAAGILNGAMIFLLGSLVPGVVVWEVVVHWSDWIAEVGGRSLLWETAQAAPLIILSLLFMRTGIGLVRTSVLAFRRRRRSRADS